MTDLFKKAIDFSKELTAAFPEARQRTLDLSNAEAKFTEAWTTAQAKSEAATVSQKNIDADAATIEEKKSRDYLRGMEKLDALYIRSLMQQISLMQSLAKAGSLEHDSIMNGQME